MNLDDDVSVGFEKYQNDRKKFLQQRESEKGFNYNIYNRALLRYELLDNCAFQEVFCNIFKGKRKKNRKHCPICDNDIIEDLHEFCCP